MDRFDAEQFICDLDAGTCETDIGSEIDKLNYEQLGEVAEALIRMRHGQTSVAGR
jgi:hypothetical protein